jgi:hypothetical protein
VLHLACETNLEEICHFLVHKAKNYVNLFDVNRKNLRPAQICVKGGFLNKVIEKYE